MRTKAIRSLASLVAGAALLLAASTSGAAKQYTFAGKLTSNRGKSAQVPLVGNTGCGGLTFMSGPGVSGTVTPSSHPNVVGINDRWHRMGFTISVVDRMCVKHAPGVEIVSTGEGVGGAFTL